MFVVMDGFGELNDVGSDDSLSQSPPPSSSSLGLDPFSIGSEPWVIAEKATEDIIGQIQPTVASEERRRKVIDYVQRLLKSQIVCEVFPFGSVPLKTYLPDGDIDLTAFGGSSLEEPLAHAVTEILEAEDQNPSAECIVKDVQYIPAEVKLVKCLVQNIVVDISFNQLGGLCTLCFLEQVDRLIGKNHLFKRSIILIKTWCYYESRILGAHHGLISTYALETLVLYIFHLFHSSLNGPLAVLYKFLDYFSKFDWDNLCVSLNGPIPISSFPGIVKGVEKPENSGSNLLLTDEFLKECVEKFSVPARGADTSFRAFSQKHLNIVDPLKETNNLGRSVSKGNFYRIKSAFSYGARKLGQILVKPNEDIAGEVCKFFPNTLVRHGKGLRPDVQDPFPVPHSDFAPDLLLSASELAQEDMASHESEYINSTGRCNKGELQDAVNDSVGIRIDLDHNRTSDWQQRGLRRSALAEPEKAKDDICFSGLRLSGDAKDMATIGVCTIMSNGLHSPTLPSPNDSNSPVKSVTYAPRLHFSRSLSNGNTESGLQDNKHPAKSRHFSSEVSREQEIMHLHGNHTHVEGREKNSSWALTQESACAEDPQCSSSSSSCSDRLSAEAVGCRETSNPMPDLSGAFAHHLENLHDARRWCDLASGVSFPAMHQRVPGNSPWDAVQFPPHMAPNMFPQVNINGVMPRPPPFFPPPTPMVPLEDLPRPRGTGTYFPNPTYYNYSHSHSQRDRPSQAKGRVQAPLKSPRGNGRVATFSDRNSHVRNNHRDQSVQSLAHSPGLSPRGKSRKDTNGFMEQQPERVEELASIRQSPPEAASSEGRIQLNPAPVVAPEGFAVTNDSRLAAQLYQLKDEEDFPPLSI